MELDKKGITETVLPIPHIKSVVLENIRLSDALSLGYSKEEVEKLQKNVFGRPKPKKGSLTSETGDKYLFVKVVISIRDHEISNNRTTWITNDEISKYLKLHLVLARQKSIIDNLNSGGFKPRFLKADKVKSKIEEQIIDLGRTKLSDATVSSIDGKKIYTIELETFFVAGRFDPKELSLFSSIYFDEIQYELDNGTRLFSKRGRFQGKVVSKRILEDSVVKTQGFVFSTDEGKIWTGAVHKDGGKYFGGLRGTDIELTKDDIFDVSISDRRVLDNSSDSLLSLINVKKDKKEKAIQLSSYEGDVDSEDYFTPLFISKDMENRGRGVLSIDIIKLLNRESLYGVVTETLSRDVMSHVLRDTSIKNIQVYRERVSQDKLSEKLIRFSADEQDELIVISKDVRGKLKAASRKLSATSNRGTEKEVVGKIKEVFISLPAGYRSFTFTDSSMKTRTDGLYRYYIIMELEDGILSYMKRMVKSTNEVLSKVDSYLADAVNDANLGKGFSDRFTQRYDLFFPNTDKKYNDAPWILGSKKVFEILRNLSKVEDERSERIFMNFINMTDPHTGSVEGIQLLSSVLRNFILKIKKGNPNIRFDEETDFGNKTFTIKDREPSSIQIRKRFNSILDSNVLRNVGYDFLNFKKGSVGLKRMPIEGYRRRIKMEMRKYYTHENPSTLAIGGDFSENMFSYLSVANILLGPNKISTLGRGKRHFDKEQYITAINNIISFNENGNILPLLTERYFSNIQTNNLTTEEKKDNDLLADLMSGINVSFSEDYQTFRDESEEKRTSLVDSTNILGSSTEFTSVGSFAPPDNSKLDGQNSTIFDNVNLTNIASSIVSSFALANGGVDNKVANTKKIESVRQFDFAAPQNALDKKNEELSNVGLDRNKSIAAIRDFPNQLKSILNSRNSEVRTNWLDEPEDIYKEAKSAGMTYFNFQYLQRVEYLQTFESDSEFYPRKPVWAKLNKKKIDSLGEDDMILCRMIEHADSFAKIGSNKKLRLPVFDEYFFIGSNKEERPPISSSLKTRLLTEKFRKASRFQTDFVHNTIPIQPLENVEIGTNFDSEEIDDN